MHRRTKWGVACLLAVCSIWFYTCTKQGASSSISSSNKQKVQFYLTDGPGFFDSVFVDIQTVAVVVDTCSRDQMGDHGDEDSGDPDSSCTVRDTVNFSAGLYNLTSLSNGVDTILASGDIPQGRVRRIIVTLGPGSYLVKDGIQYPLNMPGNADTRIVIKLKGDEFETSTSNIHSLWLDFDVERSVFRLFDGKFYLRPVIRIFAVEKSGGLKGVVLPRDAFPIISVYNGQDTLYALPNHDGNFFVRGLPTGVYNVFINASNGYNDTTITNVNVTVGKRADVGVIHLSK